MIREMEYICTINKEKNFTKAAELLMISQPALSATVRKVENEIGIQIFDRSTKPISLTLAGQHYIKCAEQILGIVNDMDQYFDNLKNLKTGRIRLGGSSFFCCYIFPPLILDFKKLYPGIEIEIIEGSVSTLRKKLNEESIDLFICIDEEAADTYIETEPWYNEKLLLAVPSNFTVNHRLYQQRLTLSDIENGRHLKANCPVVSISAFQNESFITLPKGNDIYKRTKAICEASGFNPHMYMAPDQQLTAYYLVRAQMGIGFIREQLLSFVDKNDKMFFYCINSPLINRSVKIAHKKNRNLPFAVTEFIQYMKR